MVQLWYFEMDGDVIGRMLIFINTTVSKKQHVDTTDTKQKAGHCIRLVVVLVVV